MPMVGSVQKFGDTCSDELRLTLMLLAIVLALRPSCGRPRAVDRRRRTPVASTSCCRCASAMPGMAAMLLAKLLRDLQVVGPVVADQSDVDLRRQAEIEDLRDDVGGLEIEHVIGKRSRQHLAQLAHIVGRRRVTLLQRHHGSRRH